MKFTWGTGIFIFLIIFLALSITFVFFAFSKDVNLVHNEYYVKGLNYTEQMQIEKRSEHFKNVIYFNEKGDNIQIFFPDNFNLNLKKGKIFFFRPSDRNLDIEFDMKAQSNNMQTVSKEKLIKGRYLLKFSWFDSLQNYYIEKEIFVK